MPEIDELDQDDVLVEEEDVVDGLEADADEETEPYEELDFENARLQGYKEMTAEYFEMDEEDEES